MNITVVKATKGEADVTAQVKELVDAHRKEAKGIWLEFPVKEPWTLQSRLSVWYQCAGKDRYAEMHSAGVDGFFKDFMFGVQAFYRIPGKVQKLIPGPKHYSAHGFYSYFGPSSEQTIQFVLEPGEFINQVTVRSGEIMDGLQLSTNFGRRQQFGGMGGSHHELGIPPNHAVKAFFGSMNGVLARLGVVSTIKISQDDLDKAEAMIQLPSVLAHAVLEYVGFDLLTKC